MRRSGKVAIVSGTVVAAVAAYGTFDVYDVVPGFLTLQSAPQQAVPVPGNTVVGPKVDAPQPVAAPATASATSAAPIPATAALKARIEAASKNPGMPSKVTMVFKDAQTGTTLYDKGGSTAMTPASITKLLTAWAISQTMQPDQTFTTKVVAGAAGSMVLVAGGDTCLNPKAGDPSAVCGRAGVGDLATQIAAGLKKEGRNSVSLGYDASYDPGPSAAPGWAPDLLTMGYTTRIAMLGLSTQHAETGPAVANPDASTTSALAAELTAKGIKVTVGGSKKAAVGGQTVATVKSAPLRDQLGFALQESDNSMIESLARQAAYQSGIKANTEPAVTGWVRAKLVTAGFDVTGLKLADVCGLSDGTTLTAGLVAQLLSRASTGKDPQFADTLTRLAVSGWDGTLAKRFAQPSGKAGLGWVRAKTGSLPGVASLAGTVLDVDGRLIDFAIATGGNQPQGPVGAQIAIDAVVASVRGCGCN